MIRRNAGQRRRAIEVCRRILSVKRNSLKRCKRHAAGDCAGTACTSRLVEETGGGIGGRCRVLAALRAVAAFQAGEDAQRPGSPATARKPASGAVAKP